VTGEGCWIAFIGTNLGNVKQYGFLREQRAEEVPPPSAVLCLENSVCRNGHCKLICKAGYANCNGEFTDGCEVNLHTDVDNCEKCGCKCPKPQRYGAGPAKCRYATQLQCSQSVLRTTILS
jgi:hypothetical protein